MRGFETERKSLATLDEETLKRSTLTGDETGLEAKAAVATSLVVSILGSLPFFFPAFLRMLERCACTAAKHEW